MKRNTIRRWAKRLFLLLVLASGLAYARWYRQENLISAAEPQQFEFKEIKRGDIAQTVTATGELMPVTKVEVSSQISGYIQEIMVDFNSHVKAGQVIAKLDPATYEANLLRAKGDLVNAKADLELARINEKRVGQLRKENMNSQSEYDVALANLHKAEAAVLGAEGSLKKAEVDLARCTIYSPIDGMVILRNVEVGQTVAASLSAPVLMTIAHDLGKMQIEANVVEADIGMVKEGQPAEFRVDAYPSERFKGKLIQVRNAPREEMNVVVYRTIIEVENPDLKLKPGMTATVSIIVASRQGVVKVPNSALRYKPPKGTSLVEKDGVANAGESASKDSSGKKESKESKSGSGKGQPKVQAKATRNVYLASGADAGSGSPPTLLTLTVQCGISDGSDTEVLDGLVEGDRVITGTVKPKEHDKIPFNPFAFLTKQ